jgi:hypothetical protein
MKISEKPKNNTQLIWGAALIIVGVAVFFRIPQVMPQLAQMGQSATTLWVVKICFYLMGVLLVGGGTRKVIQYRRPGQTQDQQRPAGTGDHESDR